MSDEPKSVEALTDWGKYPRGEARERYTRGEIERMLRAGEPVLYAIATIDDTGTLDEVKAIARQLMPVVTLRLVPGAVPPDTDPSGALLPEGKRGKVLACKVGQLSAPAQSEGPGSTSERHTGPARVILFARRKHDYQCAEISEEPTPVPFDQALAVLKQWGHGVPVTRYRPYGVKTVNPDGTKRVVEKLRDQWLVEEVCAVTEKERKAQGKPKRNAASPVQSEP